MALLPSLPGPRPSPTEAPFLHRVRALDDFWPILSGGVTVLIGPPQISWRRQDGRDCELDHHPAIPTPITALRYLNPGELGSAVVHLVRHASKGKLPGEISWISAVPMSAPGTRCIGLAVFVLPGSWGPLYKLLLDAAYTHWELRRRTRVRYLHPADAYLRFAPIPYCWTEDAPSSGAVGKEGRRRRLVLALSRHCSKTTLLRSARQSIRDLKEHHPGRRRWIAGPGESPLVKTSVCKCWILVELDLNFTAKSMQRRVQQEFRRLKPGVLEFTPRHRPTPQLIAGLWVHYRRRADRRVTSRSLRMELQERFLFTRPPFPWDLDRLHRRFCEALRDTLSETCGEMQRRVDLYLPADPEPSEIPRR